MPHTRIPIPMASVRMPFDRPMPTNLAPLPALLAYAQSLGLERYLRRAKRGLPTLAAALLWLVLAWWGSGRPDHLDQLDEPFLAAGAVPARRSDAPASLASSVALAGWQWMIACRCRYSGGSSLG